MRSWGRRWKGHRCEEKAQKASLRRCHLKALERKARVHQVTGGSREPHLQSTVGTVEATCSRELKYSGGLALSAQDVQSRARWDRTQGERAHCGGLMLPGRALLEGSGQSSKATEVF